MPFWLLQRKKNQENAQQTCDIKGRSRFFLEGEGADFKKNVPFFRSTELIFELSLSTI